MARKRQPWTPEVLDDAEIRMRAFIREHLLDDEKPIWDAVMSRWIRTSGFDVTNTAPDDCPEDERPTHKMMSAYAKACDPGVCRTLLIRLAKERAHEAGHVFRQDCDDVNKEEEVPHV